MLKAFIKIMSGPVCIKTLDAQKIDHMNVTKYFDTEEFEKSSSPHIKVERSHVIKFPVAKSGRILCVFEVDSGKFTEYLFNADCVQVVPEITE